jgi:hypothetical protein
MLKKAEMIGAVEHWGGLAIDLAACCKNIWRETEFALPAIQSARGLQRVIPLTKDDAVTIFQNERVDDAAQFGR